MCVCVGVTCTNVCDVHKRMHLQRTGCSSLANNSAVHGRAKTHKQSQLQHTFLSKAILRTGCSSLVNNSAMHDCKCVHRTHTHTYIHNTHTVTSNHTPSYLRPSCVQAALLLPTIQPCTIASACGTHTCHVHHCTPLTSLLWLEESRRSRCARCRSACDWIKWRNRGM